jgi:hypothetical protein
VRISLDTGTGANVKLAAEIADGWLPLGFEPRIGGMDQESRNFPADDGRARQRGGARAARLGLLRRQSAMPHAR